MPPNALMTLKEYLEDYASEDTRKKGLKLIEKETEHIPNPKIREIAIRNLKAIAEGKKRFSIMSLTDTPNANRLHIALFGRRNSGKSSLINALTGQDTALVSDTPGTTTDPVAKAMEIHGIGPCLFIDTPGFDDEGELGRMRIERTWKAVEKTDMAILFCGGDTSAELSKETKEPDFTEELYWLEQLKAKKGIPTILLINKTDIRKDSQALAIKVRESFGDTPVLISAKRENRDRTDPPDYTGKTPSGFRPAKYHRNVSRRE